MRSSLRRSTRAKRPQLSESPMSASIASSAIATTSHTTTGTRSTTTNATSLENGNANTNFVATPAHTGRANSRAVFVDLRPQASGASSSATSRAPPARPQTRASTFNSSVTTRSTFTKPIPAKRKRYLIDSSSDEDVVLFRSAAKKPAIATTSSAQEVVVIDSDSDMSSLPEAGMNEEISSDEEVDSEIYRHEVEDEDWEYGYHVRNSNRLERPPPSSVISGLDSKKKRAPYRRFKRNETPENLVSEFGVRFAPYWANRTRDRHEFIMLHENHPSFITMWDDLQEMPDLKKAILDRTLVQPKNINRQLKGFQLQGVEWMKEMEKSPYKGGLLGDEMGLGKTIQAVSLIMSDWPQKLPTLVLAPPVALMQWVSEIQSYTDGSLTTFLLHLSNRKAKGITAAELKEYNVVLMSYNSLESFFRRQEKGVSRRGDQVTQASVVHSMFFHRVILDEAHCIKSRTTMTAKACFALKSNYRWCLSGTPLQNRIGEYFSLVRFLRVRPFALYMCKRCPCEMMEWDMNEVSKCRQCQCAAIDHVSLFNQQLLNPIQSHGNDLGESTVALERLRMLSDKIMLRREKKDHMNAMELPVKEIRVDRQFFGEEENDFSSSIMTNNQRKFDTYVAQGVVLNNYANIFGLIMQMRQIADHPDLLLKKHSEGGQNVVVCCICDEPAEEPIRSKCKHDFCRQCAKNYVKSASEPDCPVCHILLSIDLEQPALEVEDTSFVKKSSIINRIKMENWTSSTKIELLVHQLWKLRSDNASHKSIIFSQFTTMLQLIEWRLRRAGITTVMLDGTMTPVQRQASINHFMTDPNVECFLVSLRAGGVALNLTEASHVFIVDPWWNPAAEWQSADRCHRIGQTRPCSVTRLCIEDSVESRMVQLQEKKTKMIHTTINGDQSAFESLSAADLQFLFRGT